MAFLISLQLFASAWLVPIVVLALVGAVWAVRHPLTALFALAVYLPFEPLLLKFLPDAVYVFVRYVPEILIYCLVALVLWRLASGRARWHPSPLDVPFAIFLVILAASSLINAVPPFVAVLGIRQIIRFILLFFIVRQLEPDQAYIRRLTIALFGVAAFEAALGLIQHFAGGQLDAFLLPSAARQFSDITLTSGVSEFWDPGSRVFATLGRYDRLGEFLGFFLAFAVAFLYQPLASAASSGARAAWSRVRLIRRELWWLLALGIPALVLTYSRASWFAFLGAALFIAVILYRDRRALAAFLVAVALLAGYLVFSKLNVSVIVEEPGQTLAERFFETFSYTRWVSEYYGLGRLYWIVETPRAVVRSAPFFGVGPGQYGGGAAAALHRTAAYDRLNLPFGVYGTDGYIDNNWFSLWGETGTLGLIVFLWMFALLFRNAWRLAHRGTDAFSRGLGAGYAAALLGASLIGFLSTAFEIRTFGFYLWLCGGFVLCLLPAGVGKKRV